ncbi:RnfABCDGE type electron transport complex subunit D [Myxococcota bacterium]|nr:RnfABCDGE type electron transport complex subunit D [Myxococcota bacterium]MBU1380408.1 RnfABCDGE type electron transport complex subunit D [Myxococcota bacterium]MBU1498660.1 RnfABCDGE type electron transport complex subunit D [Myxococcota bacterium]
MIKLLRKAIDGLSERTKTGPLQFIHPVFEAVDAALFDPDYAAAQAPFIRDALNAKRYVFSVVIAAMPILALSTWFYGYKVPLMLFLAYGLGALVEGIFAWSRKETISEGFLVTGILFVLIFPVTTPLWIFSIAVVFGIIFGKEVYGGVGNNIFNPALVGRLFVFISWPAAVSPPEYLKPAGRLLSYVGTGVDAITTASPLALFKTGNIADFHTLFVGPRAGCIGEISSVLIIAGGLYLIAVRVVNWRTIFALFTAVAAAHFALAGFAGKMMPLSLEFFGGGLLLGAFFMASDPVTGPSSKMSKYIYGAFIGACVVIFRRFTPLVESVMFSILLANAVVPLIDAGSRHFRKLKEKTYV